MSKSPNKRKSKAAVFAMTYEEVTKERDRVMTLRNMNKRKQRLFIKNVHTRYEQCLKTARLINQ